MYTQIILRGDLAMTLIVQKLTTAQKIQENAIKLFAKLGISNVSVNDILQESGLSRRTFYKYFKSKIDILRSIPEIKLISNLQTFFLAKFPSFFRLEPSSQLNFLIEGLYEMLLSPSDLELVFLEILQREELLYVLNIDVKDCYRKNYEFVYNLFQKSDLVDPQAKTHFFLFFLDGILLNCSLFQKYKIPYSFREWLDNSWKHMKFLLNLQSKIEPKKTT